TACCERTHQEGLRSGEPERHVLLALTSREVTLFCDRLPGKDCLVAVGVWANEVLPMAFLLQRPEQFLPLRLGELAVEALPRDERGFAVGCRECDASGEVDCKRCDGSGIFKPRADCNRCQGRGTNSRTCP